MTGADPLPAAFLGHGNPMKVLDHNRYTEVWRGLGASVGRPAGVLCISAHWYTNATAVTSGTQPCIIHGFYGFPDELFAVDYPAPGDQALASRVVELLEPTWVGSNSDSWVSTTAPGRFWSTSSPTQMSRWCNCANQRHQTIRVPPKSAANLAAPSRKRD